MTRKTKLAISTAVIAIIIVICVLLFKCNFHKPQKKNFIPESVDAELTITNKQTITNQQPVITNSQKLTVSPTFQLAKLIELYEQEVIEDSPNQIQLAALRLQWSASKEKGETLWNSDKWMKKPEYYKSLKTFELSEVCFSKPIIAFETSIFENSELGIERIRIFHNGFAELFEREDMWEGILHIYDFLASRIDTKSDLKTIVETSGLIQSLSSLYSYPAFKNQIKGKESIFLSANLRVLRKYHWYIEQKYEKKPDSSENINSNTNLLSGRESSLKQNPKILNFLTTNREIMEDLGPKDSLGFFCEPCMAAQTALMLAKQVYPQEYCQIEPAIINIRWPQKQNISDLKYFIDLVIGHLEKIIQEHED